MNFKGKELINEIFIKLNQNSDFKDSINSLEIINSNLNINVNDKILTINSSEDGLNLKDNSLFRDLKSFVYNFSDKNSSSYITLNSRIKELLNLKK